MSNPLIDAINDAAEALYAVGNDLSGDGLEKARLCEEAFPALGRLTAALGTIRRAGVMQARQSMSAAEVAEALGITRGRVYQILDERQI